jgi:serine/threonine protein kinase
MPGVGGQAEVGALVDVMRAPLTRLEVGHLVAGKFALLRVIAESSISQLFEAEDLLLGRRVVIKSLLPGPGNDSDLVRRFRREAHATALAAHPNVVAIYEVGRRDDGSLFLAQELLTGPTLEAHLAASGGRLEEGEALRWLTPIAGALASAHALGIVHRDVKPSNIVMSGLNRLDATPKLIDFGVARVEAARGAGRTMVGVLLGTARTMSPEQALGEGRIDGRADAWALGVVLYEALAGRCPFEGPNDHAVLAKVLSEDAPRLEVVAPWIRPELAELVHAALVRDVTQRIPMRELYFELLAQNASRAGVVAATPASWDVEPEPEFALPIDDEDSAFDVELDVEPDAADDEDDEDGRRDELPVEVEVDVEPEPELAEDAVIAAGEAAQSALQRNALDEAIEHVERGIAAGATGELLGRLQLAGAIAGYWLGAYDEAGMLASSAMVSLAPGSTGWCAALGHHVLAVSRLGRFERLAGLKRELEAALGEVLAAQHVIAVARVAIALTSAGALAEARRLVRDLRERLDEGAAGEAVVLAWIDLAFAERAMFVGDPARELTRYASAYDRFASAGDVRNACHARAAYGTALIRIGAFDEGERLLAEVAAIAAPMKLHVIGVVRASLALSALRRNEPARAEQLARDAVQWALERDEPRIEGRARVYLARARLAAGDAEGALHEADLAEECALAFPALVAHARAARAAALLEDGRSHEALAETMKAIAVLDAHGGAGEAESLIRLTHVRALLACGDEVEARSRASAARVRVHGLAERLPDPRQRRWFVERIEENRALLELARAHPAPSNRGLAVPPRATPSERGEF